jgi:uroporphyrinogen decarboxylase
MNAPEPTSRFLRATRRLPVDATPVWLMRQAGRYMPEYRAVRGQHSMLDVIRTPELAAAVTMQPIDAFALDAAIIFSDILPILEGMGLNLDFVDGEGPQIFNPLRSADDVKRLQVTTAEESLPYVLKAIGLVRKELQPRGIPLIGFSGAPFTLAAYAIEGKGSKNYKLAKSMMMADPSAWHELMGKLADVVGEYLLAQARAGAQVLQMFDSWVGCLSPSDYRTHVLPYSRRAIAKASEAGVPVIHFGVGTNGLLEDIRDAGGDVIGVDWAIDLRVAWDRIGPDRAVQGNLDPIALFAPWDELKARAQVILDGVKGRPGHIFNLGHGILPGTPVDNVRRLVEFVHEYTAAG